MKTRSVHHPMPWARLSGVLALLSLLPWSLGGWNRAWADPSMPKPSAALVRSLQLLDRDLLRLHNALPEPRLPAATGRDTPADTAISLDQLTAPPPQSWPTTTGQVSVAQEVELSLEQAVALAVRNDPDLSETVAAVRERRAQSAAVSGRLWPRLAFDLSGGFSQSNLNDTVRVDNVGIYPLGSPFLVRPNGSNHILTNLGGGQASLRLDWELVSFARNAELAETKQELEAAQARYGNRLRQLQLDVSLAYYHLQLGQQLRRVRQVQLASDLVVRDEVQDLYSSGLVPRVDQLRAEAQVQQGRMKLEQATAQVLSRQRQLSNLINAPYNVTLTATEAVRLQPPWPLDLQQTLLRGFDANPQLLALDAARRALNSQADRHAAELLPKLHLYAAAGAGQQLNTQPIIDLQGCCGSAHIPQLASQSSDWAAGVRLQWRLFDGATSQSLAAASRAAAQRTEQEMARSRNSVRQQLEESFYDHRAALQQIVAARAAFKAAREAFRDVRARYQLGLANYTDVSSTVALLTSSMEGVAEAITLANVSYAQLLRQLLPVPQQPPPASVPRLPLVLEGTSHS